MFAIIPKNLKKTEVNLSSFVHFREGLVAVFQQKELLIYSIIAVSVYTPLCVLADLWGAAFLMEKFSLPRAIAAQSSLYLYGGLTLGSLLLPWLSLKWGILKEVLQLCAIGLMISLSILLYADGICLWQLASLLTLIGLFCGAEMICFAGAAQHSPLSHTGLALGVVNTLNMLGGGLAQQVIGWYLDFQWKGEYNIDGVRFYGASELTSAFSLLIIIIFACCLLSLKLSKKTMLASNDIYIEQETQLLPAHDE